MTSLEDALETAAAKPLPGAAIASQRTKLMLEKLYDLASRGRVQSLWAEDFIVDMKVKLDRGESFSARQLTKIEELFERW